MDMRPIGVFDSGVGGLTALRSLRALLPRERLIYFGDTARVPYGGRSREEIVELARQDLRFLRSFDPKAVLVACGTITTAALGELQADSDFPVLGVVESSCRRAVKLSRSGRIGLVATEASIRSGAYEAAVHRLDPSAEVLSVSCPRLAPLIEAGHVHQGDPEMETAVGEYLRPLLARDIDTLILGCTHYPLIQEIFQTQCGPEIQLISAGEEAAGELAQLVSKCGLLSEGQTGGMEFYASSESEDFRRTAALFLREEPGAVRRIEIEQY